MFMVSRHWRYYTVVKTTIYEHDEKLTTVLLSYLSMKGLSRRTPNKFHFITRAPKKEHHTNPSL